MKSNRFKSIIKTISCTAAAGLAYAAVIVDDDGIGFVGKGDVQEFFGWNNAQLQAAADDVQFRMSSSSETITEYTWTCDRDAGPQTQERATSATITTSTAGILNSVARVRKQVTGFNLNGFDQGQVAETINTKTTGYALYSCPAGWTAINKAEGESVTEIIGEGLEVSGDGGANWYPLPITPLEEI